MRKIYDICNNILRHKKETLTLLEIQKTASFNIQHQNLITSMQKEKYHNSITTI